MIKSVPFTDSPNVLFRLDSITETPAPDGAGAGVWYRYVITQGSNIITGLRSGTRVDVDATLEDMVERLNHRLATRRIKS